MWTWCFRASLFTLFKISPSRGSQVLLDVLGEEFDGTIGCDYFSPYRKYMRLNENVAVQFCLAHLIRDVKFLVDHPNSKNRAYGRRVLKAIRSLFGVIHRRGEMTKAGFSRRLRSVGEELEHQATYRVPPEKESQNLANRFRKHGEQTLHFITTPGIEPTNNLAEQAIRFVVIDRKITLVLCHFNSKRCQSTRFSQRGGAKMVGADLDGHRNLRPDGSFGLRFSDRRGDR